jgi:hypothetical protein
MKGKAMPWDSVLFSKLWKFADIKQIADKLKSGDPNEKLKIETNKIYTLYKDLFGVKIEFGQLRILKITHADTTYFLNKFIHLSRSGKRFQLDFICDLKNIMDITKKFNLEKPDLNAIKGYILNQELAHFIRSPYDIIQIKYKDKPENIFYIYQFYFILMNNKSYLVIEKNI